MQASTLLKRLRGQLVSTLDALRRRGRHSVLVVLQGMDAAGKDGAAAVLRDALKDRAPPVRVEYFRRPTALEHSHDFLWRVHRVCPQNCEVVVFNRSHYEDVLVPQLQGELSPERIARRYKHIKHFESHLSESNVVIIKVMLHVSKGEQHNRLVKRQTQKQSKLSASDWSTHDRYEEYCAVYENVMHATSTEQNPWFVVPADVKWLRDVAILELVLQRLQMHTDKHAFAKM